MPEVMKPIGERLRSERTRLGLSQGDFSEKCGIHKNSLRLYEQGERSPTLVLLLVFQDVGVDISYVLTGRRSDGTLGFSEQHHLDMLSKLSVREREAVFALVATLAGEVVSLQELDLANIGKTLHDKSRGFRGEGE
jgi:transcriptional regulator with XRE-family HTH domain